MLLSSGEEKEGLRPRSQWVRRRYYIEDSHIKPVLGSEREVYDPFCFYYGAESKLCDRSLYLDLVALDENDRDAIERFTSRWGLLGLFYHPLLQLQFRRVLPAVVRPDPRCWGGYDQVTFVPPGLAFGEAVPGMLWEAGKIEGSATVLEPDHGGWRVEPLSSYSKAYLTGLSNDDPCFGTSGDTEWDPDRRLYRILTSTVRWDYLCEPISEFQAAVRLFRETYELCVPRSPVEWDEHEITQLQRSVATELRLVQPVPGFSPTPGVEPRVTHYGEDDDGPVLLGKSCVGRWEFSWSFPSLLAAAYMMLCLDLTGNRNLRICASETCNRAFVTDRADRIYCSDPCNNRQKQRAHRRRAQR